MKRVFSHDSLAEHSWSSVIAVLVTLSLCVSAGELSGATVELSGTVRDFRDSHPDFEGPVGIDKGIVRKLLGSDRKPAYAGQSGNPTTSGSRNFSHWFNDTPSVNRSKSISILLDNSLSSDSRVYTFVDNSFFPIDRDLFGNQGRSHNYHFTFEMHSEFRYQGGEVFKFEGDDDVWVFIDNKLVIDLGGVHGLLADQVKLDTLGLELGQTYPFDLFFAERHTIGSHFRMETSIDFAKEEPSHPDSSGFFNDLPVEGLVAFYPLNCGVRDASGNDYHGFNHGATPTTDRFGLAERAYSFDGDSDYISLPSILKSDSSRFTISLWYMLESGDGTAITRLWSVENEFTDVDAFSAIVGGQSATIYYNWDAWPLQTPSEYFSVSHPHSLIWRHLGVVKNLRSLRIYLDGVEVESVILPDDKNPFVNDADWLIGRQTDFGRKWHGFNGAIDDIRFYDRALPPDDVLSLYRELSPETESIPLIPSSQESHVGDSVLLGLPFDLLPTDRVRWYFNGAPIAGASETQLDLQNVTEQNQGRYTAIVDDSCGLERVAGPFELSVKGPPISIIGGEFSEGDQGVSFAEVKVTLDAAPKTAIPFRFYTEEASAQSELDFVGSDIQGVVRPGQSGLSLFVPLVSDRIVESDESFAVHIVFLLETGAIELSANIKILNDDVVVPRIVFSPAEAYESSGFLIFKAAIQPALPREMIVRYSVRGDSASSADFLPVSEGYLTMPTGAVSATVSVELLDDMIFEMAESVELIVYEFLGGVVGQSSVRGQILNDDPPPVIEAESVEQVEGNSGETLMRLRLGLKGETEVFAGVDWTLTEASATKGSDFQMPNGGTLTYAPSETEKFVVLRVFGDRNAEADELVTLSLTNAVNAVLSKDSVTATILNDDDVNRSPSISDIPDQVVGVGESLNSIEFDIFDSETGAEDLQVYVESLDPDRLPDELLAVAERSGGNRSLSIASLNRPTGGMPIGIRVTVTDEQGASASTEFSLTVLNDLPTVEIVEPSNYAIIPIPGGAESVDVSVGILINDDQPVEDVQLLLDSEVVGGSVVESSSVAGRFEATLSALGVGEYHLTASARDTATGELVLSPLVYIKVVVGGAGRLQLFIQWPKTARRFLRSGIIWWTWGISLMCSCRTRFRWLRSIPFLR